MEQKAKHIDWYILLSVAGLMLFSIAFVYSASASFASLKFGSKEALFIGHSERVLGGIVILILFAKLDYHIWLRFSKPILLGSLFLLLLVLLTGVSAKGAARWLNLGFFRFQPTELAKFALVLHLSNLLTRSKDNIDDFKEGLMPLLIWTGAVCILIILQPNFSNTLVIFSIALAMMFIGNARFSHLLSVGLGAIAISAILVAIKSDYRMFRILAFFGSGDTSKNLHTFSYQLQQSLIAFGNGGMFGIGPGQSRQSNLFLPESYGDFIFSIIGEEYGLIGAGLVILIFMVILWRGVKVAKNAPDDEGYFLAFGIVITFCIYAIVNAFVNCGLMPTTGLPMPFISYGGSAVIFHAASMGILLNISSKAGIFNREKALLR